jgi:hypothetical protein
VSFALRDLQGEEAAGGSALRFATATGLSVAKLEAMGSQPSSTEAGDKGGYLLLHFTIIYV